VPDDRVRNDHDAPAVPSRPPRQIGVLVVREEPRIEEPDVVEHRRSEEDSPAAEPIDRAVRQASGDRPTEPTVEALTQVGQSGPEAVEELGPLRRKVGGARTGSAKCDSLRATAQKCHAARASARDGDQFGIRAGWDPQVGGALDVAAHVERPRQVRFDSDPGGHEPTGHVQSVHLDPLQGHPLRCVNRDRCNRRFEHHAGRSGTGPAITLQGIDERTQPARLDDGIVVDQGHVVDAGSIAHRPVAPLGEPEVLLELQMTNLRELTSQEQSRSVDGSVVNQDQLHLRRRVVGGQQGSEAASAVPGSVPVDDDHPDPGYPRHRHADTLGAAIRGAATLGRDRPGPT